MKNKTEIPTNTTVRHLRSLYDQAKLTVIFGNDGETAIGGLESIDKNISIQKILEHRRQVLSI